MDKLEAELQKALLPRDPNDDSNLFLEIRAGTGGDESALFAGDLFRMYTRYAERQRWQVELISESPSELGGYKEVIARIVGQGAYSKLKFESGGHRVQRVPETETQGRIHTSACTVAVLPEADEVDDVVLNPAELRIDTFRASGAGGQHVNKTDSAIRITHLPTGIVVECQDARSQHKNSEQALSVLAARIKDKQESEAAAKTAATRKSLIGSGDRSERIRTYNFPQGRVTDHRINLTLYKIERIMDGELDDVVDALAAEHQAEQLAQLAEKAGVKRRRRRIAASGIDAREARLLLAEACGFSQASLAASPEQEIPFEVENAFLEFVGATKGGRAGRLPPRPQGVLRPASLRSIPSVLIPRPETELLVDLALERKPRIGAGPRHRLRRDRAGDQACKRPDAAVVAVDATLPRLPIARRNAAKLDLDVDFRHGRWFEPVAGRALRPRRRQSALRRRGRSAPRRTCASSRAARWSRGPTASTRIREIVPAAGAFLRPGGWLLLEHGMGQDAAVSGAACRGGP